MLALAALVVVVALILLGGGAAFGALGLGGDRGPREGLLGGSGPAIAILGVVGVVIVLFVAPLLLIGVGRGGSGADEDAMSTPSTTARATTATTRATTATTAAVERRAAPPRDDIRMAVRDASAFPDLGTVADELEDGMVLKVTAQGFVPHETGRVAQCRAGSCINAFPVQFGAGGDARFQYQVFAHVSGGECDGDGGCALVVTGVDGRRADIRTVFGGAAPEPGRVVVRPRGGLENGETVTVAVEDFEAGARLDVVQCVPPAAPVAVHCGAPGPVVSVTVGRDGRASASFTVAAGPVGRGGAECGRRHECGVAVIGAGGALAANVARITFSAGPGAGYDPLRVAGGLLAAAILASIAAWLIRATDWQEPTEAATPEMDAAQFVE